MIEPKTIELFYEPAGTLRMVVNDDRCYPGVKIFQAWPLSQPGRFIAFQDAKGDEITMIDSLEALPSASKAVAEEEMRRRYLTSRVETILGIRTEFGVTYWHVLTDRGERDFVVQSLSESCVWLSHDHILIIDVDGNRFEIPDRQTMEEGSRRWLESVL